MTVQASASAGPGAVSGLRQRRGRATYPALYWAAAAVFAAVVVALVVAVASGSAQAFANAGVGFIWSGTWNPAANHFAAGVLVVGTVVTTATALLLAVPVGLAIAVYLSELAPRWLGGPLSTLIELLAAVPSIVVGLWALLVLSPVFARHVEPFLSHVPGLDWFFHGPAYGPSILLASVVLAIMTLPTMVALTRSAFQGVARADREAVLALGGTRWQVVRTAVLPSARSGIAAAVTLAAGRALGEAIAVAMVIGNRPAIPHSLLAPGATLASAIVNQFAEATPGLATSSVIALGAVLLLLTLAVNAGGQSLLGRRLGDDADGGAVRAGPPGPWNGSIAALAQRAGEPGSSAIADIAAGRAAIRSSSRRSLWRRRLMSRSAAAGCALAVAIGAAPLVALAYYTVARGASVLSWSFLTHGPTPPGIPGGGISSAIVGSVKIVGIGLAMSVPLGLLTALFIYERRDRMAAAVRFSADVMTGIPSILIGIFAYSALISPLHHYSDLVASFALAVLMVPIMIRANEEALVNVPVDLWEAGIALGAGRGRVARSVVVRTALPRLIAGNLLAAARGIGETAPLLFTVAAPTLAVTLLILNDSTQPYPAAQQTAWAAALLVLGSVLALSLVARVAGWALTRKAR